MASAIFSELSPQQRDFGHARLLFGNTEPVSRFEVAAMSITILVDVKQARHLTIWPTASWLSASDFVCNAPLKWRAHRLRVRRWWFRFSSQDVFR